MTFINIKWKKDRYKSYTEPGVVALAYNPSSWEAEAEGLWVWGKPTLHSDTCLKKTKQTARTKSPFCKIPFT
jgi:hypothetical protein